MKRREVQAAVSAEQPSRATNGEGLAIAGAGGGTAVKICGIRERSHLEQIALWPIDYIGFVFAESKRRVTVEQAAELAALLRQKRAAARKDTPLAVGVFVNPTAEELATVMAAVPLDVIQLHGEETPEFCRRVKEAFAVKVFKALPVVAEARAEVQTSDAAAGPAVADGRQPDVSGTERLQAYAGAADAVLLDTLDPNARGGTGKTFAWNRIPAYLQAARRCGLQLIVAGGLAPANVAELVAKYRPDGVDVSSGVETDGVKDVEKIKTFVERVKKR